MGTPFQDRLVSEFRLAGAKTMEQAQAVLIGISRSSIVSFSKTGQRNEPAWKKVQLTQLEQSTMFQAPTYGGRGQHGEL